jgi:hypothetical protein
LATDQLFTSIGHLLFTKVVMLAEKEGKPVRLLIVGANSIWDGIIRSAAGLRSHTIVLGKSSKMSIHQQARMAGLAWERLPPPRPRMALEIHSASGEKHLFYLGPHPRHLMPREVELLDRLWLRLNRELVTQGLHHHEIVDFSLRELERELSHGDGRNMVDRLERYLSERDDQSTY